MAALSHPGIVDVYDYGEAVEGQDAYLVMTHVTGQPLDERLAAAGRLDPAETMSIVAKAAHALHAAHQAGIIHRDVKPANLLVQDDGTVVLVDFGIAQAADTTSLTGINEVVGTAAYIAPEQVTKRPTGPATDVYALGVVAYQCVAGHQPFLGDNAVAVARRHIEDDPPLLPADVPEPVRNVIATAMAKDPADRYPTAEAMAEAAEAAMRPRTPSPVPLTDLPTAPIRRQRSPWPWIVLVTGMLAAAVLGIVLVLFRPTVLLPAPDVPTQSPGPVPAQSPTGANGPSAPGEPTGEPGLPVPTITVVPPSVPGGEPTVPPVEPTPPEPSLPEPSLPAASPTGVDESPAG
jgi:serine/threonine-protein kinase